MTAEDREQEHQAPLHSSVGDHLLKADELLGIAHDLASPRREDGGLPHLAAVTVQAAQVHATIAVAKAIGKAAGFTVDDAGETWYETSRFDAHRECGANVSYPIGEAGEYSGDGECGWQGSVTLTIITNGRERFLTWTCGDGHGHEEPLPPTGGLR